MKKFTILLLLSLVLISCSSESGSLRSEGVSRNLADSREANYSALEYKLHFEIPSAQLDSVAGEVEISFTAEQRSEIIIDYATTAESITKVVANGESIAPIVENQHIIIPKSCAVRGRNVVQIAFSSPSSALNLRENFVYTLLVPDRARALFPLFEQPNLKARYTLSLTIPESWEGISNSAVVESEQLEEGLKKITYQRTEPISSYLFAFAAGEFTRESRTRNGREHHLYHMESDEDKLSQIDDIYAELFHSLDWLEEYTEIEYPFSKYDMVLIPSFQYGGMEHIGATFYNASTMFTSPTPTINERMSRAKLIAHETSHMWFGDLVTMAWFDDVWTKEVFANFFAAKIVVPLFPEIDQRQSMLSYFASAYGEDRTQGGTAIRQELDNMRYAGLVYNSIIYDKSPIVLNMIFEMLGEEPFRQAISETLKRYSYDSATWEQWLEIFDSHSEKDVTAWARNWMYESGMPTITIESHGDEIIASQSDPKGRNLLWEQDITLSAIAADGTREEHVLTLDSAQKRLQLSSQPQYIVPNSNGMGYGYFVMDEATFDYLLATFSQIHSSVERRIVLINLYENMVNNPQELALPFVEAIAKIIPSESDPLIYSTLVSYATSTYNRYIRALESEQQQAAIASKLDKILWSEYRNAESAGMRAVAFNALSSSLLTEQCVERVYDIWSGAQSVEGISINIDRYISISYELALKMPARAEEIISAQRSRIESPHLQAQYEFISRAVSPNLAERQRLFEELLQEENRGVEAWVQASLALLTRDSHSERYDYLRPALDTLEQIQRTGDIFFPQGWCRSLLTNFTDAKCAEIIDQYIADNPQMQPMLKSKLMIASDHIYRISAID